MADGGVARHFLPGLHAARHLKKLCGCSSAPVFPSSDLLTMPRLGGGTATMKWTDRIGLSKPARDEAKTQQEKLAKLFCAVDLR